MLKFQSLPALAIFLLPFTSSCRSSAQVSVAETKPGSSVQSAVDQILKQSGVPALGGAIIKDGAIETWVAGIRIVGKPDLAAKDDRFAIGSLTKQMTGLMISKLIDEGKLTMATQLGQIFPNVDMLPVYKHVTVQQLLEFKAGIQPYERISPKATPIVFELSGTPSVRRDKFMAHVLKEPSVAAPGTKFVYSNATYTILGQIIERLANKPWEAVCKEWIFGPLDLKSATIGDPAAGNEANVHGHVKTPEGYVNRKLFDDAVFAPAGGATMSMEDFARFAGALVAFSRGESKLFKPETQKLMAPVMAIQDGAVLAGGNGMFTASMQLIPQENRAVVAATNSGDGDQVCGDLLSKLSGKAVPRKRGGLGFGITASNPDHVEIANVAPGSPAEKAGLKNGDLLLEVNGKRVAQLDQAAMMAEIRIQGGPTFKIKRGTEILTIHVKPN